MKRLLIATTNPAKLKEYRLLLHGHALELVSLRDLHIEADAPETGATFIENARLKAAFYFARADIPTLADDGGLEVDALGGAPGVHSHRWLGDIGAGTSGDRLLAEEVIRRMAGIETGCRNARMRAAAVLIHTRDGLTCEHVAEAALEGVIADHCHANMRPGFPYRAVLYLPARGCYLAELSEAEEARLSQRRVLVEKLAPHLERLAAQR
ncbi:MAG: non-canonical purine NTP pyrophosphatase [Candidatus Binataceae bacterium]